MQVKREIYTPKLLTMCSTERKIIKFWIIWISSITRTSEESMYINCHISIYNLPVQMPEYCIIIIDGTKYKSNLSSKDVDNESKWNPNTSEGSYRMCWLRTLWGPHTAYGMFVSCHTKAFSFLKSLKNLSSDMYSHISWNHRLTYSHSWG